jgi:hypothetical protein
MRACALRRSRLREEKDEEYKEKLHDGDVVVAVECFAGSGKVDDAFG